MSIFSHNSDPVPTRKGKLVALYARNNLFHRDVDAARYEYDQLPDEEKEKYEAAAKLSGEALEKALIDIGGSVIGRLDLARKAHPKGERILFCGIDMVVRGVFVDLDSRDIMVSVLYFDKELKLICEKIPLEVIDGYLGGIHSA